MARDSIDWRPNILPAYARRMGSQRALADVFGVRLSLVEKLLRRHRTTGAIAPKRHAGGQPPRVDGAAQAQGHQLVPNQPEAT
jgi:transposase